jgi:hypothetical protein
MRPPQPETAPSAAEACHTDCWSLWENSLGGRGTERARELRLGGGLHERAHVQHRGPVAACHSGMSGESFRARARTAPARRGGPAPGWWSAAPCRPARCGCAPGSGAAAGTARGAPGRREPGCWRGRCRRTGTRTRAPCSRARRRPRLRPGRRSSAPRARPRRPPTGSRRAAGRRGAKRGYRGGHARSFIAAPGVRGWPSPGAPAACTPAGTRRPLAARRHGGHGRGDGVARGRLQLPGSQQRVQAWPPAPRGRGPARAEAEWSARASPRPSATTACMVFR